MAHLTLTKPHNINSDWYAFNIMLMQSLLYVGPYGGVYKPKDKSKRVKHTERPLRRITVFNQDVKYPKPAIHYSILPDSLLHQFNSVFEEDKRGEFPINILDSVRWTSCTKCGMVHARNVCPSCVHYSPSTVVETVRGNVTCTKVFQTSGIILFATIQDSKLRYLFYENGKFKREDNLFTLKGQLKPTMRFRIRRKSTLIGYKGQVISLIAGSSSKVAVDNFGSLPIFDSNEKNDFWIHNGRLMRSDLYGPKYIGSVLSNQTLFWVGQQFGFGFYRASNLNVGFVFNTNGGNINDSVNLPIITGQLIDSTCFFSSNWVWFFTSVREKGQIKNRCIIVKSDGSIKASAEVKDGDGSWLGSIRNKCAAGNFLLAATDDGIVRVSVIGNSINISKVFPDTEPFVDSGCHLLLSNDLFVVSKNSIKLLKII
jgi:H/ACA ribonucleoprotein complex subunit 3